MAAGPINPTALTPPRVAFIDDRTGAISREWYRFFLSLVTATKDNQNTADVGPDVGSLLASYDAVFSDAVQALESTPDVVSLTASLENRVNMLAQSVAVQPRNELGTISYLQQDNIPWLTFSPVPSNVPVTVGTAFWDGGQTLNLQQTLNVAGKINEDNYYYIKADSTISKGQLVMFTGAVGASGVLKGAPATGLGINDGVRLMGIAAENIATNGFGMVQWAGTLRGFNTTGSPYGETWADGDILYYNPSYAGGLTKVEPTAPNVRAVIAAVINAASAGSGSVAIRLSVGSVLGGTDSNVYINGLANGDVLQYDGTDQRWENTPASSITIGTATNIAGGLANQLVYQTAPNTTGFATVGTGLLLSGGTLSNSAPDQTVTLTAGTGISISGTYPSFTITNSAPDQIISLTGAGTTVVTGTYPNFTITSNDQYVGTVTSVSGTGSVNGITLSGTVTSSGSITLGGTLSNVSLTSQVTGTLPVGNGGTGTATAFTAGSVVFAGTSGVYTQDNANFNWDDTNNTLGVGRTASSNVRIYSKGGTTGSGAFSYYGENSAGTGCFGIRDDGAFYTGAASLSPYNLTTAAAANVVVAADYYLYRSTSSARYKTNIVDYNRGLDAVMQLRPVYYEGKSEVDAGKRFAGFIAEEVYDAGFDEFVVLDDDKKPDALHYGNMTALLVKALQDAAKQIDILSTRVAALERR